MSSKLINKLLGSIVKLEIKVTKRDAFKRRDEVFLVVHLS